MAGEEVLGLHVVLVSGKSAEIKLSSSARVAELEEKAARSELEIFPQWPSLVFGGQLLQRHRTLASAGLADGDTVSAMLRPLLSELRSDRQSSGFYGRLENGSCFTVGGPFGTVLEPSIIQWMDICQAGVLVRLKDGTTRLLDHGGSPNYVRAQVTMRPNTSDLARVVSNRRAAAGLRRDGSVVLWGSRSAGGLHDGAFPDGQLREVRQIAASRSAFAAILEDGQVVAWGDPTCGGRTLAVEESLKHVQSIAASASAFAAILLDGTVVTWGDAQQGGDSSAVRTSLKDVIQVEAGTGAFAALRADGTVVTWGEHEWGGDSSEVQEKLYEVRQISASFGAFAAVRADGRVVAWGHEMFGGQPRGAESQLLDVAKVVASKRAFCALRYDGSVVAWGDEIMGGSINGLQDQLKDVQDIYADHTSFCAKLQNDRLLTWGCQERLHAGNMAQRPPPARVRAHATYQLADLADLVRQPDKYRQKSPWQGYCLDL